MADSVYTRLLGRALALESAGVLATTLRVPRATLDRWVAGKAPMPVQAFLNLITLVSQREAGVNGAPPAGDGVLTFPIGRLLARCARCDGNGFVPVVPDAPLRMTSELACGACGEKVVHGELIARLGAEAVQQARAVAVAGARRQSRSPRREAGRAAPE